MNAVVAAAVAAREKEDEKAFVATADMSNPPGRGKRGSRSGGSASADEENGGRRSHSPRRHRERRTSRSSRDSRSTRHRDDGGEGGRRRRHRRRRTRSSSSSSSSTETRKQRREKEEESQAVKDMASLKGGAYIPPWRMARLQASITDKTSAEYQRLAWQALKKSINGNINKVSVLNIKVRRGNWGELLRFAPVPAGGGVWGVGCVGRGGARCMDRV